MKNKNLLGIGIGVAGAYILLREKPMSGVGSIGAASFSAVVAKRDHSVIAAQVRRLYTRLGPIIARASMLTGSPAWAITGIAANEISDFKYDTVNKAFYAAGVMQQTPGSVIETVKFARKYGFYTPAIEAFFQQKMGSIQYQYLFVKGDLKPKGNVFLSIVNFLRDPEYCTIVGSLMIRVLIYWLTDNGNSPLNIHALATCYNHGTDWTFDKLGQVKSATPEQLVALQRSTEGRVYIPNVAGVGGYFEQAKLVTGS